MFNYDFEKTIEMPDLNTIPELLRFKTTQYCRSLCILFENNSHYDINFKPPCASKKKKICAFDLIFVFLSI